MYTKKGEKCTTGTSGTWSTPHDVVDGESALLGRLTAGFGRLFVDGRRRAADVVRLDGSGRFFFFLDVHVDLIFGRVERSVVVDTWNAGERDVAFRTDGMGQDVTAQVAIPPEDFLARRALVRFEVGVRQQVSLEVGALVEAARTDRTLVRRFLQVKDPVDGQSARLAESFAAISALERLLLRVDVTAQTKKTFRQIFSLTFPPTIPDGSLD